MTFRDAHDYLTTAELFFAENPDAVSKLTPIVIDGLLTRVASRFDPQRVTMSGDFAVNLHNRRLIPTINIDLLVDAPNLLTRSRGNANALADYVADEMTRTNRDGIHIQAIEMQHLAYKPGFPMVKIDLQMKIGDRLLHPLSVGAGVQPPEFPKTRLAARNHIPITGNQHPYFSVAGKEYLIADRISRIQEMGEKAQSAHLLQVASLVSGNELQMPVLAYWLDRLSASRGFSNYVSIEGLQELNARIDSTAQRYGISLTSHRCWKVLGELLDDLHTDQSQQRIQAHSVREPSASGSIARELGRSLSEFSGGPYDELLHVYEPAEPYTTQQPQQFGGSPADVFVSAKSRQLLTQAHAHEPTLETNSVSPAQINPDSEHTVARNEANQGNERRTSIVERRKSRAGTSIAPSEEKISPVVAVDSAPSESNSRQTSGSMNAILTERAAELFEVQLRPVHLGDHKPIAEPVQKLVRIHNRDLEQNSLQELTRKIAIERATLGSRVGSVPIHSRRLPPGRQLSQQEIDRQLVSMRQDLDAHGKAPHPLQRAKAWVIEKIGARMTKYWNGVDPLGDNRSQGFDR